jgi:hypothetical protein
MLNGKQENESSTKIEDVIYEVIIETLEEVSNRDIK